MNFFAIANSFQEDVFYDVSKKEDTMEMSAGCLFPVKELAVQYIEDELSSDYVPVQLTIHTYKETGVLSYGRGQVDRWDIIDSESKIFTFQDAKEALQAFFNEKNIEDFGYTKTQLNEFINDIDSPLYQTNFLLRTALCFHGLERTESGFIAYVG